ncbi:MAG TPA: hypothetical protein PLH38_02545 [Clostridia bacterium]|nr:hypothetical protein [Clostridia bacterium]
METNKCMPYDWHTYLAGSYNSVFDFDIEKTGHGYMFLTEINRNEEE